jgi:hypothetical protein
MPGIVLESEKIADSLYERMMEGGFLHHYLNEGYFSKLVGMVQEELNLDPDEKRQFFVREVLVEFFGKLMTEDRLVAIAKKVSYAHNYIRKEVAFVPDSMDGRIAIVKCINAFMSPEGTATLELEVAEGPLGGKIKEVRLSPKAIQYVYSKIGLRSRKWRRYHPREIVGCAFTVILERKRGDWRIDDFYVTKKQKGRNARLKRKRQKSECECESCVYCPKNDCKLSTHTVPWKYKPCPQGGKHKAYTENGQCLICLEVQYKASAGILKFGEDDIRGW